MYAVCALISAYSLPLSRTSISASRFAVFGDQIAEACATTRHGGSRSTWATARMSVPGAQHARRDPRPRRRPLGSAPTASRCMGCRSRRPVPRPHRTTGRRCTSGTASIRCHGINAQAKSSRLRHKEVVGRAAVLASASCHSNAAGPSRASRKRFLIPGPSRKGTRAGSSPCLTLTTVSTGPVGPCSVGSHASSCSRVDTVVT